MKQSNKQSKSQSKSQARNPVALTPSQLKSRQNQLLVVDIRGWFEYWMGHISGAQCFSRDRILKEIPKNRAIAITCLSGHRSKLAAQKLVDRGYSQVYNLEGGLLTWQRAGYAVRRGFRP